MECEVITTLLDQSTDFHALSYCWGSEGSVEDMLCDGARHTITPSLNAALKAYRHSPQRELPIWVDAVSINQANKTELSQQIPLMRQIYREAVGVIVHLGEAEGPCFQALELISLLFILQRYSKNANDEVKHIMYDILPKLEHPSWDRFFEFFSSPWFYRTWILQEIALAKNASCYTGRIDTISWEGLEGAVTFFERSWMLQGPCLRVLAPWLPESIKGLQNVSTIQGIRRIAQPPGSTTLMQILHVTNGFHVSDPRDKIFGVLGLVGDIPAALRALIDYGLSTSEVYQLAAIYLIEIGFLYELFHHAGLERQSATVSMPSWVSDWNSDMNIKNLGPLSVLKLMPSNAGGTKGGHTHIVRPQGEVYPREIAIHGFYHYTITKFSEISNPSGEQLSLIDQLRAVKRCFEECDAFACSNVDEAFARTLLVDELNGGAATAIKTMAPIAHLMPTFEAVMEYVEDDNAKFETKTMPDEIQTFIAQIDLTMVNRRFAVTDSGHMALVPGCTEFGDVVAFFLQAPVPYILRTDAASRRTNHGRDEIHAKLVGDCYVHEMMHGEAISEAERENKDWSVIVLD